VIIGATSAIAQGVARAYAQSGSRFFLVARDEQRVMDLAAALRDQGAERCAVYVADLRVREVHADIVQRSIEELGRLDLVFVAHGVYPERERSVGDVNVMLDSFMTNAVSALSLIHRYGLLLREQEALQSHTPHPCIAVVSSVAGDRGRFNNYTYGSAKAALTAFASGLRAELAPTGVDVLTIKPGPVETPLTKHHRMPLMTTVEKIVPDIVTGIEGHRTVVYTPWYWRWIMLVIKSLPERIFMKLRR
jgi:short-subunit dehydrogenase